MSNWKEVKLKELIQEMGDGGTPTTTDVSNFGGDIPWVVVDDVVSDIYTTKETLTEKGFNKCSAKKWPKGSIILTTGATIGQVGIARIDLCTKQGITGIIPNEFANNIFLKFWFEANTKQLIRYAQGTTFKEIRPRSLGNIRISIPNPFTKKGLHEQTAIATILSKIDEGIKATTESIVAAKKLKKALMQNLLSGKLKPDGNWRTEDEFYEDEKFRKVPKGWEIARVKDYGFLQTGKTPPTAEPNVFSENKDELRFPFITPGDLGELKYINSSERYVTTKGIGYSYKIPVGAICVVCIGSTIGKIGITTIESCTNQQINTLIPNENNSGEFFYYMMEFCKNHFKEIAGINATPQINRSDFNKYKMLRPKEKIEQEEIAVKLISIDKDILKRIHKIKSLERLKKSLMQQLLTGKKRLSKETIAYINQTV